MLPARLLPIAIVFCYCSSFCLEIASKVLVVSTYSVFHFLSLLSPVLLLPYSFFPNISQVGWHIAIIWSLGGVGKARGPWIWGQPELHIGTVSKHTKKAREDGWVVQCTDCFCRDLRFGSHCDSWPSAPPISRDPISLLVFTGTRHLRGAQICRWANIHVHKGINLKKKKLS